MERLSSADEEAQIQQLQRSTAENLPLVVDGEVKVAGQGEDSGETKGEVVTIPKEATASAGEAPFQIQSWDGVCHWKWDPGSGFENCSICRTTLHGPSINYQANPTPAFNAGLKVAFGSCGHCFHLDCLQKWHITRPTCPLCSQEWDMTKVEIIPGYEHAFQ